MTKVVVLGGGPAGDVAALRAAQLGAEVTLIEEDNVGGTCLNWGCIPTKALLATAGVVRTIQNAKEFGVHVDGMSIDFPQVMAHKETIVEKLRHDVESACSRRHVRLLRHHGVLEGDAVVVDGERIDFDRLIVCVGTRPSGLSLFDMEHPRVITSDGALRLETLPKELLVVGGGVIGCEFASLFATLGTHVTVVEAQSEILPGIERKVATQFRSLLTAAGVTVHVGTGIEKVVSYRNDGLAVELANGDVVDSDWTLVAVGRAPRTRNIGLTESGLALNDRGHLETDSYLQTAVPSIYGAGDCIGGPQLAHLASAEAARAVENALGHEPAPMDRTVVPATVYTHPEIATVGLTSEAAKGAGHSVTMAQARFAGNGKALAEGETTGGVYLVTDSTSDVILGATIMGPHAVESIHEIAVAISDSLTMDDLASIIHAHPTVSELVMDAAQNGEGIAPYLS